MKAQLQINENPEVLIKDIIEGYMKGNHTLWEMLDMIEAVLRGAKMKVEE